MKIYFAGSIKGGRDKKEDYYKIINELKKYGEVLTEHIGEDNVEIEKEEKFSIREDERNK